MPFVFNDQEKERRTYDDSQPQKMDGLGWIPLRVSLLVPFVVILMATVGLTGFLSMRSGHQQVHELAGRLLSEISLRTRQQLKAFSDNPHTLNGIHMASLDVGTIDAEDVGGQLRHHWRYIQAYKHISHTFFANDVGDFAGARVLADGSIGTMLGDASTDGNTRYHYRQTDASGNPTGLTLTRPKGDVTQRPWYAKAKAERGPTWSPIYSVLDVGALSITACEPVFKEGKLLGVFGSNYSFKGIGSFLRTIKVGEGGVLFLMERSGELVSSSTPAPNIKPGKDGPKRIRTTESASALIRLAGGFLESLHPDGFASAGAGLWDHKADDNHYFIQMEPFQDGRGLDWLTVLVLPEKDVMAHVTVSSRHILYLMLAALVLSSLAGVIVGHWVLDPISQLNRSARAMANGDLKQMVGLKRKDELGQLARSFNAMVAHINALLGDLKRNVAELNLEVEQRRKAQVALEESKERYQRLFDSGPDAIFVHEPLHDGRPGPIIEANRVALVRYGYSQKEYSKMTVEDLVAPEERKRVSSGVKSLFVKKAMVFEPLHQARNGRVFPVEVNSHLFELKGKPTILSIVRDMTLRRKLEGQLQQTRKMESIGTLAGGIAHDFNNILSSIIGYTELAQDAVSQTSVVSSYLDEVFNAGKRARELVKQILYFARPTDEKVSPVRMDTIVKEVLKFMRSSIASTITIDSEIRFHANVMGNSTQLYQVILNLCTNAAQAMDSDGGTLSVGVYGVILDESLTSENPGLPSGEYVKVVVSDTGPGISPQELETIFDPYFTTKAPGEGTGMGLSLVHGIVTRCMGQVTVESEVGVGSSFSVYLPVTQARESVDTPGATQVSGSGEHVLVVDDEAPVCHVMGHYLKALGYSVTSCTSSVEALGLFRHSPEGFDLVITDMTMPQMTGDHLAEALMTIRPEVPVIICTGFSRKINDETMARIGIRAVVLKPVVKDELGKVVKDVLAGATKESE